MKLLMGSKDVWFTNKPGNKSLIEIWPYTNSPKSGSVYSIEVIYVADDDGNLIAVLPGPPLAAAWMDWANSEPDVARNFYDFVFSYVKTILEH